MKKKIQNILLPAFSALFAVVLWGISPLTADAAPPGSPPALRGVKAWTFMIFMAADNNLESSTESDINELETVGSTENLNIVIQLDRLGKTSFNDEDSWGDTRRFYITKDNNPKKVSSKAVSDIGEIDMATPQALLDFVKWARANYPAKHYALIFWDHGTGWKEISPNFFTSTVPSIDAPKAGISNNRRNAPNINYNISYDDTSGSSMDIPTLGDTLKLASKALGQKFDLVGFDACLMQMAEVAFEIAPSAMYQVASPDREPDRGWPYDDIIKYLAANPTVDGKKLGSKIVSAYKGSYQMGSQGNTAVILSLIDLSRIDQFMDALKTFSKAVETDIEEIDKLEKARHDAVKYVYEDYLDLEFFLRVLINQAVAAPLKKSAENLIFAISGDAETRLIVENGVAGDKFKNCGGLAVFFPERSGFRAYKKRYKFLEMSAITGGWYDLLEEYETPNLCYLKIVEAVLDDNNHDGKIAPGESVKMKLLTHNFGKMKAAKVDIVCEAPTDKVTFKTSARKITEIPDPGKESTIEGFEFTVSESAQINSEIPIRITLSGEKVPLSTYRTNFFVKSGFVSNGHVLLVFADGFSPAAPVLQTMFNAAGLKFDIWDRMLDGNIKPEVMKRYLDGWVYVCVQDSSSHQQLQPDEVEALSGYLKTGGKLVLSGQDLAFSLRETPFLKDQCKISFIQDDTNVLVLSGLDKFAGGATFQIYGGDGANNQKWPDEIDPFSGAKLVMKYDSGARDIIPDSTLNGPDFKPGSKSRGAKSSAGAAVQVVDGYRLLFFSFGIESINSADNRNRVFRDILAFMAPTVETQVNDYANASSRRKTRRTRQNTASGRQIIENIDMLKNLQTAITRQIKSRLDQEPDYARQVLEAIDALPEPQRLAASDLEKDVRSLLEFQRNHGTVNAVPR